MRIIVALGNPGEKYKLNRHNYGWLVLDKLQLDWSENKKLKSLIAKDGDTLYVKPLTYMNNSGEAVEAVLNYYKLLPRKMLMKVKNADLSRVLTVIHDDLDIEFGTYKESIDSRSAGQRGVQSIIDRLKTKNFRRIRLGIKSDHKPEQMPAKAYVLQDFRGEEMGVVDKVTEEVVKKISKLQIIISNDTNIED
jgi:PTH1 family peptidyl-tRNA hydrolase